jgi:hypothetical protein
MYYNEKEYNERVKSIKTRFADDEDAQKAYLNEFFGYVEEVEEELIEEEIRREAWFY